MPRAQAMGIVTLLLSLGCSPRVPSTPPSVELWVALPTPGPQASSSAELPEHSRRPWVLEATSVSTPLVMRLAAGHAPFATIKQGPRVRMEIPPGLASAGARLEIAYPGIEMSGAVGAKDLGLHLARATMFRDFVLPLPSAELRWMSMRRGRVTVSLPLDATRIQSPASVTEALECQSVALNADDFGVQHLLPQRKPSGEAALRTSRRVPLRVNVEEPPAAWLYIAPDKPPWVATYESSGDQTQVHAELDDCFIFGWVPTDSLEFGTDALGAMWGDEVGEH